MKKAQQESKPHPAEVVIGGVGIVFTLAFFGFAGYEALTTQGGPAATARVVSMENVPNATLVEVEVANAGGQGLLSVTLRVDCGDPPVLISFNNVPVGDRRRATAVCPAGGERPPVSVVSFVAA